MAYYIGVDIGGTNTACGVVNENCEIVARSKIKTNSSGNSLEYIDVLKVIKSAITAACEQAKIDVSDAESIGVGSPGVCNSESGIIENCSNIAFDNSPIRDDLEKEFGIPVYLDNDANAAAFGEFMSGAANGTKNAVIITLGTGVGAGIIIDGKIFRGSNYAGGEIGHTVIVVDGLPCGCGRRGCFEAYSSATGLIKMTLIAAEKHPESIINRLIEQDGRCSARTPYNAMKAGDPVGKAVTDNYVKYLACGITNVINTFQPEVLCIGGGVCNEGDILLKPLKEAVAKQIYSKNSRHNTEIVVCKLGNDAGIIGAAMLHKS